MHTLANISTFEQLDRLQLSVFNALGSSFGDEETLSEFTKQTPRLSGWQRNIKAIKKLAVIATLLATIAGPAAVQNFIGRIAKWNADVASKVVDVAENSDIAQQAKDMKWLPDAAGNTFQKRMDDVFAHDRYVRGRMATALQIGKMLKENAPITSSTLGAYHSQQQQAESTPIGWLPESIAPNLSKNKNNRFGKNDIDALVDSAVGVAEDYKDAVARAAVRKQYESAVQHHQLFSPNDANYWGDVNKDHQRTKAEMRAYEQRAREADERERKMRQEILDRRWQEHISDPQVQEMQRKRDERVKKFKEAANQQMEELQQWKKDNGFSK